nr:FkbM family methyltransferase [Leptolyngbyaceae cyanobacterium MO_188.B28]
MLKEAVNTFFPNAYSSISEYKEEQKQYTELEATYWPLKLICPKPLWNFISGHRKSLSQCMQDYWVMNSVFHNKRDGFFLDIGSTDGITINNTFLLEKRLGWKGICIEANPHYYKTLKRNRKCTCLNLCVGEAGETVEFKLDNIYSGITETSTDNGSKEKIESSLDNAETFVAETVPLIDILKENQAPKVIDYLSIDVEGYEEKILRNFPFEEYRFSAITIE